MSKINKEIIEQIPILYKKYGVTLEPEVKFLGDFEA